MAEPEAGGREAGDGKGSGAHLRRRRPRTRPLWGQVPAGIGRLDNQPRGGRRALPRLGRLRCNHRSTERRPGAQPHGIPGVKVGGAAQQNRNPVGDWHSVLVGLAPQRAQAAPAHLGSSQQRHHGPFLCPNHVDTNKPQEPEVGQERRITGSGAATSPAQCTGGRVGAGGPLNRRLGSADGLRRALVSADRGAARQGCTRGAQSPPGRTGRWARPWPPAQKAWPGPPLGRDRRLGNRWFDAIAGGGARRQSQPLPTQLSGVSANLTASVRSSGATPGMASSGHALRMRSPTATMAAGPSSALSTRSRASPTS